MIDTNPWFWITSLGTPEIWFGIAVSFAVFYFVAMKKPGRRKFKPFLRLLIIALLIAFALVVGIKEATGIPRPCGESNPYCDPGFSFPSGHSASIFVVWTSLLLFNRRWLLAAPLPILVAYSRVALGVHTPLDITAGALLGIGVVLKLDWVFKRYWKV